ncbi:MAG: PAS domain-containing protein [Labilithrix sp.]
MRALVGRAVDELPDAFVLVEGVASDGVGRKIIFVNRAFTLMTGFTPEDAIGRTPDITIGPETNRDALEKIKHARDAREHARVEILKYRKDGTQFWAEMDLIPVYDEHREFSHYCAFLRDVTARHAAQVRRMETERLAAIGTLAAGVAHEMNNPLAYALMNVGFIEDELPELIAESKDPSAGRWAELVRTVDEIRHGVSRVAQIVRDIRSFSRLDTPAAPCRVPVLVERAVQMARMPNCAAHRHAVRRDLRGHRRRRASLAGVPEPRAQRARSDARERRHRAHRRRARIRRWRLGRHRGA